MLLEICEIFDVSADYMIHNDYESDEDIPAVKEERDEVSASIRKSKLIHRLAGIFCTISALCSIFGFGFLITSETSVFSAPVEQLLLIGISIVLMVTAAIVNFVKCFRKR